MSIYLQKWIAIIALALMPAVLISNVCATSYELAKLSPIQSMAVDADLSPCESGPCPHANLCDLAHAVFVTHSPMGVSVERVADRIAETLQISIPAEPRPPLKPPVV
jgi:hypothetical protein